MQKSDKNFDPREYRQSLIISFAFSSPSIHRHVKISTRLVFFFCLKDFYLFFCIILFFSTLFILALISSKNFLPGKSSTLQTIKTYNVLYLKNNYVQFCSSFDILQNATFYIMHTLCILCLKLSYRSLQMGYFYIFIGS